MAKSKLTLYERFWRNVDAPECFSECWAWTGAKNRKGYGEFWISGRTRRAHRLAWAMINGPIPSGLVINHLCNTPSCVNVDHMEVVTPQRNTAYRDLQGRQRTPSGADHWSARSPEKIKRGRNHGGAKLSDLDVIDIRNRRASGETGASLARRYRVTETTISEIYKRKTWVHLPT